MSEGAFAKQCVCVTHDGPHWLHMDELDRERNRAMLDSIMAAPPPETAGERNRMVARLRGHAQEELARLQRLREAMERRGITEIPEAARERVRRKRRQAMKGAA